MGISRRYSGCNEKLNGHVVTRTIRKWVKVNSAHGADTLHTEATHAVPTVYTLWITHTRALIHNDCWLIYHERSPRVGSSVGAEGHNLAEVWPGFDISKQSTRIVLRLS